VVENLYSLTQLTCDKRPLATIKLDEMRALAQVEVRMGSNLGLPIQVFPKHKESAIIQL